MVQKKHRKALSKSNTVQEIHENRRRERHGHTKDDEARSIKICLLSRTPSMHNVYIRDPNAGEMALSSGSAENEAVGNVQNHAILPAMPMKMACAAS